MELSIVIVNYNLTNEVLNCIESIFSSIKRLNYEIIVVDNNSLEEGLSEFEKRLKGGRLPHVSLYKLNKNVGFGAGCNYGAAKAKSEIICFLNPDTILKEDIFPELITFLNSNSEIAAVSPTSTEKKFMNFSAGLFPGFFLEFLNIFYVGRHIEAFYIYIKEIIHKRRPFKVDWLLGASILIKKDIFERLHGFDERYFLYFEEMDLFYRIRKMQLKVYFCPQKKIYHIGSVSTKKDYSLFTRTFYSSKIQFFFTQYKPIRRTIFIFLTYMQMISQIVLWTLLMPLTKAKSISKIKGFIQVFNSQGKNS